jgi:hypothetical protein
VSTSVKVVGSILKVTISSVLTAVPNCTELSDNEDKAASIDTTALSDSAIQTSGGMPDFGSVKGKCNYDPNNSVHQYLKSNLGANMTCELIYPNSGPNKIAFTGPLLSFAGSGGDRNALYKRDFEIKCNTCVAS